MRTSELAEASGYSVQQIRQLESRGVLPAAGRLANGYRSFSRLHLRALLAYRDLARAVDPVAAREVMTITELSRALGVPASTLRFWESAGLVFPDRVEARAGTARMYRDTAIRDARITSALRTGGYRIPEVREAIGALRELGDASRSLTALDERREAVARQTLALFRAGRVLVDLIDTDHR